MTVQITSIELGRLDRAALDRILTRSPVPDAGVRRGALEICESVRSGGDVTLAELGNRFGGSRPQPMVDRAEMDTAWTSAPAHLREAIESAAANISKFHEAQRPADLVVETTEGVTIDRRWSPLRRVGAYVPGGKAAYPSTLLMTVLPARVAGVAEIAVASPVDGRGLFHPALLAAASFLEIDELYAMGGAQAVGALAYGTETIRSVDKIVGPGNAWVTGAKLAVFGDCAIDMPAGPSEVLVIADRSADPRLVAIDLLCQAEHGPDSPAVLVTTEPDLGAAVIDEINRLLPELERAEILSKALSDHGLSITCTNLGEAIDFANRFAPEHVTVMTEDPGGVADRVVSAGSVYVGRWAPESAGDYATGGNHVLPTGGLAAAMNPLGVEDFGSWRQVQTLTEQGLAAITPTITTMADAEGLTAHRLAAELRFEKRD